MFFILVSVLFLCKPSIFFSVTTPQNSSVVYTLPWIHAWLSFLILSYSFGKKSLACDTQFVAKATRRNLEWKACVWSFRSFCWLLENDIFGNLDWNLKIFVKTWHLKFQTPHFSAIYHILVTPHFSAIHRILFFADHMTRNIW